MNTNQIYLRIICRTFDSLDGMRFIIPENVIFYYVTQYLIFAYIKRYIKRKNLKIDEYYLLQEKFI